LCRVLVSGRIAWPLSCLRLSDSRNQFIKFGVEDADDAKVASLERAQFILQR
jgi:hypothetical protein